MTSRFPIINNTDFLAGVAPFAGPVLGTSAAENGCCVFTVASDNEDFGIVDMCDDALCETNFRFGTSSSPVSSSLLSPRPV